MAASAGSNGLIERIGMGEDSTLELKDLRFDSKQVAGAAGQPVGGAAFRQERQSGGLRGDQAVPIGHQAGHRGVLVVPGSP